ncbi:MAG: hypothetical protein MI749_00080, partial [Desulfovibrionales bacterium]|nr:hypothetical protein [Desulfovibrionales bacterium]
TNLGSTPICPHTPVTALPPPWTIMTLSQSATLLMSDTADGCISSTTLPPIFMVIIFYCVPRRAVNNNGAYALLQTGHMIAARNMEALGLHIILPTATEMQTHLHGDKNHLGEGEIRKNFVEADSGARMAALLEEEMSELTARRNKQRTHAQRPDKSPARNMQSLGFGSGGDAS